MFGMGMGEILLIAVVALLVVGPDRLPSAAKAIGKGIRDLRASTKDLQATIEQDTQIGEAVRELKGAFRGDPETLYKRATGEDFNAPPPEKGESKFPKDTSKTGDDVAKDAVAKDAVAKDAVAKDAVAKDAVAKDDNVADAALPTPDKELGDLLDQAYANSSDPWGTEAVNPHEAEESAPDPDLPALKQPTGSVARGLGSDDSEAADDDDASTDDSSHG
jgi:sec-independent protein translocase protein TatB